MTGLSQWSSYAQFCKGSRYAAFAQEHRASSGRLAFQMICIDQQAHDFEDPGVPETILATPLRVSDGCGCAWNMGDGWRKELSRPGGMMLLPPGIDSRWQVDGSRQLLLLVVPTQTIRQVAGTSMPRRLSQSFEALSRSTWDDLFLGVMLQRLWQSTAQAQGSDAMLGDSVLSSIVLHLLQLSGGDSQERRSINLPAWRIGRLQAYVDAHLHEELDVGSMAAVVGLGTRHFSRAFLEELGETPHRWLMGQRIDKAKRLLSDTEASMSEIARRCGFTTQSHFCKVFKDQVGEAPGRWKFASKL